MPTICEKPDPDTNAWRILHDAESGVWVDNFDGHWLVQTRTEQFPKNLKKLALVHSATSLYWKPRNHSAATSPQWMWGEKIGDPFFIRENGANFSIDFAAGYSPGIFLDQRLNRQRVHQAVQPSHRILNTFAYTGAFSVMAAMGGAETTTLDLSATYLDWTWKNFAVNDLDHKLHHGIKGDAFEWMRTFARQGRTFHGIILDPPTFSRGNKKKGKKTFRTDQDYGELTALAGQLIEPGGWILCCANTHRMTARHFQKEAIQGLRAGNPNREWTATPYQMPPEFRGDDYLKTLWVSC